MEQSVGRHWLSLMHYTLEHLKTCTEPKTAKEISDHLSTPFSIGFLKLLQNSDRIEFDDQKETYAYRPLHNIKNETSLLAFLKVRKSAAGLSVKDVKDGWPDAIDVIEDLGKRDEILIICNKRDGQPKTIWANQVDLQLHVDPEFVKIWHSIAVPLPSDLPAELEKANIKPTSVDPSKAKHTGGANVTKQKKPRKRASRKITNLHLNLLRDNLRKN